MKNSPKLIFVSALIFMLGVTIYNVKDSFALFESDLLVSVDETTGAWNIYINDSDVTPVNSTFVVDDINITSNSYVKDNKMAPDTSAYFDINIVPNGTDVSVKYDITFDFSDLTSSFIIESISETTGGSLIRTGETTYSGVISLAEIQAERINNVRVNIEWSNDEAENESDSALGTILNATVSIPITVQVTQYLGEQLVEYE